MVARLNGTIETKKKTDDGEKEKGIEEEIESDTSFGRRLFRHVSHRLIKSFDAIHAEKVVYA